MYNSHYGKPDRTIHYSYVLCTGKEAGISSCKKLIHTLNEGRQIFEEAVVAGVVCGNAIPTHELPCIPVPEKNECADGELRLEDGSGVIEYCIEGQWSSMCHLTHNETTVACKQLGYTKYTC